MGPRSQCFRVWVCDCCIASEYCQAYVIVCKVFTHFIDKIHKIILGVSATPPDFTPVVIELEELRNKVVKDIKWGAHNANAFVVILTEGIQ